MKRPLRLVSVAICFFFKTSWYISAIYLHLKIVLLSVWLSFFFYLGENETVLFFRVGAVGALLGQFK